MYRAYSTRVRGICNENQCNVRNICFVYLSPYLLLIWTVFIKLCTALVCIMYTCAVCHEIYFSRFKMFFGIIHYSKDFFPLELKHIHISVSGSCTESDVPLQEYAVNVRK